MLILMTLLSLALVDARGIRGTACTSDDGSVVPSCYEHLTPELEGLSFYLPHQNNCSKYWECSPNMLICLFECAPISETELLYFDYTLPPQEGRCDWPYAVECTMGGPTNPPTTTTARTTTMYSTTAKVPSTTKAPTTTMAPTTTKTPTTTKAPTTTMAPTTTNAPTTTKAPTTTMAPTTTKVPTTTKAPTTTTTTVMPTTTTLEEGAIQAITFQTGSCIGCPSGTVEGGLKVRLEGENGFQCQTGGLDHPDKKDYEAGVVAVFDAGEVDGLQGCYQEVVTGSVTGGSVTWTGTGMFAASKRDICVQLSGEGVTWCCKMKDGYSSTNLAVQLQSCEIRT